MSEVPRSVPKELSMDSLGSNKEEPLGPEAKFICSKFLTHNRIDSKLVVWG